MTSVLVVAASYVRALEKAVLADSRYEQIVRSAAAAPAGTTWQEVEFSRAMAKTNTYTAGMTYRKYVTDHGMDPDVLHSVADSHPVHFSQAHQAQAASGTSLLNSKSVAAPNMAAMDEQRIVVQQRTRIRNRVNQVHIDAEDAEKPKPTFGFDDDFSLSY